jgi:tetratricopeptide (TPR) repeat protein
MKRWFQHALSATIRAGSLISILCLAPRVDAQDAKLGSVYFPTSGAPAAQRYFLTGIAALHSFWYEEALDNFNQAASLDPDFMMAYWGQAMCYNHPLWHGQDTDAGRKVVAKMHDSPKLTDREREYVDAVKALYGEGDKLERDLAYSNAMARVYRDYPADIEAACLYALSLLGAIRPGDEGLKRRMQAGAIALEVYKRNPDHPGAAHYIIHAFDDPDHAILALPAALHLAEIAPGAFHARHMPAHIFVQLGMWPEAARSNESAWEVSGEWVKRKHLSVTLRDYHSLHWLTYVYLQQGRYKRAAELVALLKEAIEEGLDEPTPEMLHSLENMEAEYLIETQGWRGAVGYHGSDEEIAVFVRGLAEGELGRKAAQASAARLHALAKDLGARGTRRADLAELRALEVEAISKLVDGEPGTAIQLIRQAILIEDDQSAPSGPPESIKPCRELYGEILLRSNRPGEALSEFDEALAREPNRAMSLLGRARALAGVGRAPEAKEAYQSLLKVWILADSGLPELGEARRYAGQFASQ